MRWDHEQPSFSEQHFSICVSLMHSLKLLQASQPFQILATTTFLFCHTTLVFFSLLCSQRILQLVCNSYLVSSSFPIKCLIYSAYQEGWEGSWSLCTDTCTVCSVKNSDLANRATEALAPGNKSHGGQWVVLYKIGKYYW